MERTREQKQAVFTSSRDILVSASAGSGKTTVLVDRILEMVTRENAPLDIDRLLVVTFTKSAAAEMRERLIRALEECIAKDPEREHLQRQSVLVHHAQISTIDSFCARVVQNYFHRIDLDPSYRVANESELELLKKEVLDELLEEEYGKSEAEGRADFLALAETLTAGSKDDRQLRKAILDIERFASSDPKPDAWFIRGEELLSVDTTEALENSPWVRELLGEVGTQLNELIADTEYNLDLAEGPGGSAACAKALQSDLELFRELSRIGGFAEMYARVNGVSFARLGRDPAEGVDPDLRDCVKDNRDKCKKTFNEKIRQTYFELSPEEVVEGLAPVREAGAGLSRLAQDFRRR